MALAFQISGSTLTIPGTHGKLEFSPIAVEFVRAKYFGVPGEVELFGGTGGRDIWTEFWFYNGFMTSAACLAAIDLANQKIGKNGTLVETGAISREFEDTTFEGAHLIDGPLPPSGNVSGYWAIVIFRFHQLKV